MASIFSLYGSIFIDNEKANKSIDETTEKGKKSSKSFTENLGSVAKKGLEIGTAVVGATTAVVGGLTAMANKSGEYAGSILDASRKTSITTDLLQQLKYAGEQSGVSFEDLTGSATKFNKVFADASTGNKANIKSFNDLGIAIKDSSGKARASSDVYNDTIMKLAKMGDTAEANALGNDIFGKSFANLKPLLAEGADGIEAFKEQASDLGLVMSDEAITAGDTFSDTLASIQSALGGVANQLMGSLMPILQPILNMVVSNMPAITGFISQLTPIVTQLMSSLLPPLIDLGAKIFPMIMGLITQLLPPITEIITMLLPIFTQLLDIILPPLIQIIEMLLPLLLPIIKALLPLLKPVLDLLAWGINTILMPIIKVITGIADVISKVLVTAIYMLMPVVEGLGKIFRDVFGGLFNIVKVPINFIIDGLNNFIRALNTIKIPDWVPVVGGKGINLNLIPRLAKGLDYVPYDEFPALLHKGERVLTKNENKDYSVTNNKQSLVKNVTNNFTGTYYIREEADIDKVAEALYDLSLKEA